MRVERRVLGRRGQHLVALPAAVRQHLGTAPGGAVYFHLTASGQVGLTTSGEMRGGKPRPGVNCPSCEARERQLQRVVADYRLRERTVYAEGYSAGQIALQERLMHPTGPAAQQERRRRLAALHLPRNQATVRRRERRRIAQLPPGVVAIDVDPPDTGDDQAPASMESPAPAPAPSEVSGGDAASGGEAPQAAH